MGYTWGSGGHASCIPVAIQSMLEGVKRGAITEQPWGKTVGQLIAERATGELVVIAEGKRYVLGFLAGELVGALSPVAADSVARLALTGHLVSSTQVAEITRRIAAQPERDDIEVIVEVARLSAAQAQALRVRAITQRAARTFAIEQGTYAFDDTIRVTRRNSATVDARAAIYLGARLHIPEPRLANELRQLGSRFVLRLDALDDLPKFGFTELERPIVDALRTGTSVAELEAKHRDLDPRVIAAAIYTLACCGACADSGGKLARAPSAPPTLDELPARLVNQRVTTKDREMPPPVVVARVHTPVAVAIPLAISRTMTPQPTISRTMTPQPTISRTMTPPPTISRTMTPPPLASGSSPELRRPSIFIPPLPRTVTPLPPDQPIVVRTPTGDRSALRLDARDAFQRGEMAMRREQLAQAVVEFTRAVELQPDDADFLAMLAWARFCAAPDKQAIADATRRTIDDAIARSAASVTARMCRGRVERMLGDDAAALRYFQQVLALQPRHSGAESEARVLESRLRR